MESQEKRVCALVAEHLGVEPEKVTLDADIIDDLGGDSLDKVELVMALEDEFSIEIPDDVAEPCATVNDYVRLVDSKVAAKL